MKRLLCVIFAAILLMSGAPAYGGEIQEEADEAGLIEDLILYYGCYGEEAAEETEKLLEELKAADAGQGNLWEDIMDYWEYVDTDLVINTEALPEGLPEDDSFAVVILGAALYEDGSMKDELTGRLRVGLDCAGQYPNAYVVCTGGGTAKENRDVTEAEKMGNWLLENGLEDNRLILEDQSMSTIENARYTLEKLREDYPQVSAAAIVSSDYHVARASLLFETAALMMAEEGEEPEVQVISNCAYPDPDKDYTEDYLRGWEMYNLLQLTGNQDLARQYIEDPENFPRPVLEGQADAAA